MDADSLVKIIKACGESGVTEIKIENIYINFIDSSHKNENNDIIDNALSQQSNVAPSPDDDTDIYSLQLSDPLLFEERMLKREDD